MLGTGKEKPREGDETKESRAGMLWSLVANRLIGDPKGYGWGSSHSVHIVCMGEGRVHAPRASRIDGAERMLLYHVLFESSIENPRPERQEPRVEESPKGPRGPGPQDPRCHEVERASSMTVGGIGAAKVENERVVVLITLQQIIM